MTNQVTLTLDREAPEPMMSDPTYTTVRVRSSIRLPRRTRFRMWVVDRRLRLKLGRAKYQQCKAIAREVVARVAGKLLSGAGE